MLVFFLIFLALVLPGILWKTLLKLDFRMYNGVYYLRFELRFFYALLTLRYERQMESADAGTASYYAQNNLLLRLFLKKKRKKRKKKRKNYFRFRDGVHIRHVNIEAQIGVAGDAYATVVLAGALQILLSCLSSVYGVATKSRIEPDFEKSVCRMKLESILELRITQIMTAALKRQILRIRGKKHAASD